MSFSTLIFTVFFLPIFLIVNQIVFTRTDGNVRTENRVLLIFSMVFYLFSGLGGLLVLLICALVGWFGGRQIEKSGGSKGALIATITILIAVLAFFKYAGFFMTVFMPLGISFYIFKIISYVADVYKGEIDSEDDIRDFLLYVVCFHHVTQGPIVRYGDMKDGMLHRKISSANMTVWKSSRRRI